MTRPLLFAMPKSDALTRAVAERFNGEVGILETRNFPDGESYVRYTMDVTGRPLALLCTLDDPDPKLLPLLFAADAAHELGAKQVGLITPYLPYLRQDRRFRPGEAITSHSFARLLSERFDWLVTVDPHLHRIRSLADVYTVPVAVAHATPRISDWIVRHIRDPVLIGPDRESEQWVSAVANGASAPHVVLDKVRAGDRDVEITISHPEALDGRTPVFVDDIISSGATMVTAIGEVARYNPIPPVCIAVHGLFSGHSDETLLRAGATVVTTNTVPHATNAIDVTEDVASACAAFLGH